MNETIIAQIDREIAAKQAELSALQAAKAALGGKGAPVPDAPRAKRVAPAERAPKGALEDAMLKAITAKPGLTNGEVRAALKKSGYKYALGSLYVGKRLVKQVEAKKLAVKLEGSERRYYPAK